MDQKQKDVVEVAKNLVNCGAVVQITEHIFGFGLHFIPIKTGGFKVVIQDNQPLDPDGKKPPQVS